jgi:hypothetical protein
MWVLRALVLIGGILASTSIVHAKTYLRKPAHGIQVRVGQYTIQPAEDLEVCQYTRLPNAKPVDVVGMELRMPAGAHHFAVWKYDGAIQDDGRFPQGPVPSVGCIGVAPDEIVPQILIPIQSPNVKFRFPEGLALRLDPHQQILLNPHMKNIGTDAFQPDIRFNFMTARKGSVKHYVDGLAIGNSTDIRIPAGGDQTLTVEWTAPVNLNIALLATHQHRLGTYANIELVDPDGTPRLIYENDDWQHPQSLWPKKPIRLQAGRKLRFTCQWHNTDDHEVRFGPETTDEMCFIIGFYYRDKGDDALPIGSGCLPSKTGLLCPLAPKAPQ